MKQLSIVLVIFILLFSCGKKEVKEEKNENTEPEVEQLVPKAEEVIETQYEEVIPKINFTVQIAALENQNEMLLSIDGISTYNENGLTKYRLGDFETYQEARAFRRQILGEYKDAFIQALKSDKPITITEALQN